MIIDVQFFGYGAGLVMAGWVCGMVVRVCIKFTQTIRG